MRRPIPESCRRGTSSCAPRRFTFQGSLASTDAERANPWLLLLRAEPDGAIPVIADANSMTYVLHRALGEDIVITRDGREIRLRLVAALRDSIFQSELVMAQANFQALFPDQEGYRVFLVETPPDRTDAVVAGVEDALAEFGADAMPTAERLAAFHRVENTYLSTFQTLGGLGLLLGTVGLATVLLRNALERRKELALLGAVGFRRAALRHDGAGGERGAARGRPARPARSRQPGHCAGRRGARRPVAADGGGDCCCCSRCS